jgi:hypothetical protein
MAIQRWIRTVAVGTSLIVTAVGTGVVPAFAGIQRTDHLVDPSYQAQVGLWEGVSADVLTSYELTVDYPGTPLVRMLLERVPLDPGDQMDGRDPAESGGGNGPPWASTQREGMHLLYVETGEVVLAAADEEATYRQGESVFIPATAGVWVGETQVVEPSALPYALRNDSGDCASVLRLSVVFVPFVGGATPAAASGPERGCGQYEFLFFEARDFPWPENPPADLPVYLFIARLSWGEWPGSLEETYGASLNFTGPVALVVESGSLSVRHGAGRGPDPEIHAALPPGGQLGIKAGVPLEWSGEEKGTALLVAGIIPAGQEWLRPA